METTEHIKMRVEWDQRAGRDAFHYIHPRFTQASSNEEFFESGEWLAQKLVDPFIGLHLKNSNIGVALDIGCGVGRVTRALAKRFNRVCGVDVSGEMIRLARSLHPDHENISFYESDGETYKSVEDSSIDYAFSFTTFQHMPSEDVIKLNTRGF